MRSFFSKSEIALQTYYVSVLLRVKDLSSIMNKQLMLAVIVALVAVFLGQFLRPPQSSKTFAFEKSLPDWPNGFTYEFSIVDPQQNPLAEAEAQALESVEMSPMFRCQSGLYGKRWMGSRILSITGALLRLYTLVLEDADPPDENKFIVRHRVLGIKTSLRARHDEFTCVKKSNGTLCEEWDSVGHVSPMATRILTRGRSSDTTYNQRLIVTEESSTDIPCPLVNYMWWCLGVFCPAAK